jgi:hypothetical protein
MLNAAMVFMILAGLFGLPAVMCSGLCSGMGVATGANVQAPEGQAVMDFLMYLSIGASLGSIIMGAMVKKLKKAMSGTACFVFALAFCALMLQGNMLGLVSALMLVISGIMIFVAPAEQFHNVTKVKVTE